MGHVLSLDVSVQDILDILIRQHVLVGRFGILVAGINEENAVVGLVLLHHDDAGSDGHPEEEVGRKLGLTPEEVTMREAAALSMLRNK